MSASRVQSGRSLHRHEANPNTVDNQAMTERDWTITDRQAEADDRAHREWWRSDPFSDPDYRMGPVEDEADEDGE